MARLWKLHKGIKFSATAARPGSLCARSNRTMVESRQCRSPSFTRHQAHRLSYRYLISSQVELSMRPPLLVCLTSQSGLGESKLILCHPRPPPTSYQPLSFKCRTCWSSDRSGRRLVATLPIARLWTGPPDRCIHNIASQMAGAESSAGNLTEKRDKLVRHIAFTSSQATSISLWE